MTKLISKTFLLRNHPKMGRIVPEFNDEFIRELIDGNYRIIYKISKESVGIARVYHSARELKPI